MTLGHSETVGNFTIVQGLGSTSDAQLPNADLVITVAGYEPRSTNITQAKGGNFEWSFVVRFDSREDDPIKDRNKDILSTWLTEHSKSVSLISGFTSIDVDRGFMEIGNAIYDCFKEMKRALKVCVDISSLPKSLLMFIIGFGFKSGIVSDLVLFYSIGVYPESLVDSRTHDGPPSSRFTVGEWESVLIPYLEGVLRPGRTRKAIISLGFEAPSIGKFVQKYDPDTLHIVLPNPGFKDSYTRKTEHELNLLKRLYSVGADHVLSVPAGDVLQCLKIFRDLSSGGCGVEEKIILPLGPKTHAISCALVGLMSESVSVVSRVPSGYSRIMTEASGEVCVYSISDLTAIV